MNKATPLNNYHYNKSLNPLAKVLKQQMTKSEACMWKYLLSTKQFHGFSFRRQRPILNYIVDFCCLELMLVIEVDGISHTTDEAIEKDEQRDIKLTEIGFYVFRFSSWEVLNRMVDVNVILTKWMMDNNFIKGE
ncbi:MAG: endonuclease domain-containing protein [Saprospiraceae bacterium]